LKVSVILPALNEERTVGRIVRAVRKSKLVDEVLVVDACSTDRTGEVALRAGAKVVRQDEKLPPGKGTTMKVGIENASGDILVFFDADIKNFKTEFVDKMVLPILNGEADFVKGSFRRKAGRVTELVAKPLLNVFFPELKVNQPLSGQIAGTRKVFERIELDSNWGVDVGMLLDVLKIGRIAEVELGYIEHRMKAEESLCEMSSEVASAIMRRCVSQGRLFLGGVENVIKRIVEMVGREKEKSRKKKKVVVFDVDGVLLRERVIDELAKEYGFEEEVRKARKKCKEGRINERQLGILLAQFLKGRSSEDVRKVVSHIPLTKGVKETVKKLKKRGFKIAVLSDGYLPACEVIGKKMNVDYVIANRLEIKAGRLTGRVIGNEFACPDCEFLLCKREALKKVAKKFGVSPRDCIMVGNGKNDAHAMEIAGLGVAFNAEEEVKEKAQIIIDTGDMRSLLEYIDL